MKILLIRYSSETKVNTAMPKSIIKAEGVFPPLGIAYIAAVLEEDGFNVKILDAQALGLNAEKTGEEIGKNKPDVVGITCTTPEIHGVLEIARRAKKLDKESIVILGGPHISLFPKESISFPFVDFAIQGEGEYVFPALLRAIENGDKNFKNIRGLIWKNKENITINPVQPPIKDLDGLPFPARHLLPMDKYGAIIMKSPMTTLIASRGCSFNCAPCFKDKWSRFYRTSSPKRVVDEIEHCIENYKVTALSFYDDCWPDKKYLASICNEILDRRLDIEWETPQRVDLVNPDLLHLMRRAGCIRIRYGVESGSQSILDYMTKGITLSQVRKAFRWTKKEGIETFAYFMIGYPTESDSDFQASLDLAKDVKADWVMFNLATPMPGTKLWDQAVSNFGYHPNYWHEWSLGKRKDGLQCFTGGGDKKIAQAYKEFYLRPGFVYSRLTKIRSLDDIAKYWGGWRAIVQFRM